MPKRLVRKFLPDHHRVRNHRHLSWLGSHLHDANLWHINRRSLAGAAAVGLFVAFIPMPGQMILAAAGAIVARVNLPASVALVWVTNPITIPPLFLFAYKVGTTILGQPMAMKHFEMSLAGIAREIGSIWHPLLLGSVVCGACSGLLGYCLVRLLWRWKVVRNWDERRRRRIGEKVTS